MLIQPKDKNFVFPLPQAINTEHITRAVVKLSAIGERKNVMIPVKIKSLRKLYPLDVSWNRTTSNTFLSIPMLMCMVGYGHGLPL